MADLYNMDGNKLMWHPDRVHAWQRGERIAPLHIDAGLSKGCNIQCLYCFGKMQRNQYRAGMGEYFPREPLIRYLREAGECGVRSIGLIGESEPTLNPHLYEAIAAGHAAGVDLALATNGLLFDVGENGQQALRQLTWIRFNLSAASPEAYQRIHNSSQFDQLLRVIRHCVEYKRAHQLPITIGLQMVLIPENADQIVAEAKLGAELGVDYFVVKQCSDSQQSTLGIYHQLDSYGNFDEALHEAEALSRPGYNVIIKWRKVKDKGTRSYQQCLGTPFLLYSSGDGKLYPCGVFFDHQSEDYCMGDLVKQGFREILQSDRYWEVVEKVKQIDVSACYSHCRTDCINQYLWQFTHPPAHVNFV